MAERKEITLLYQYDENWIGGSYYVLNIIKALTYLEDSDKPSLIVLCNAKSAKTALTSIDYPYLRIIEIELVPGILARAINKIARPLFHRNLLKVKIPGKNVKNLYPASPYLDISNVSHVYYWIPDFQEKYLPEFFFPKDIALRDEVVKDIIRSGAHIVFSSHTARADFGRFYPQASNPTSVLRFVSMIDFGFTSIPIGSLLEKYNISKPYFMVPNQFWRHKNQKVVIEAVKYLLEQRNDFEVVFTGKEFDYRNPDYFQSLKNFVIENGLDNNLRFLGFIDRGEQLQLMKHSLSVIQPSLFEGWSTVVEDSKAIGQRIILSAIPIHKEQITENCKFFDPRNAQQLSELMLETLLDPPPVVPYDYRSDIIAFAQKFIASFE